MYTIILNQGIVIRNRDQAIVSPCESETDPDFIEYQVWISDGNIPAEVRDIDNYKENVTVTARQARLALLQAGLLDTVESIIKSADSVLQIEWEYGTIIERNSPFISHVSKIIGLSDEDVDRLFNLALTL